MGAGGSGGWGGGGGWAAALGCTHLLAALVSHLHRSACAKLPCPPVSPLRHCPAQPILPFFALPTCRRPPAATLPCPPLPQFQQKLVHEMERFQELAESKEALAARRAAPPGCSAAALQCWLQSCPEVEPQPNSLTCGAAAAPNLAPACPACPLAPSAAQVGAADGGAGGAARAGDG